MCVKIKADKISVYFKARFIISDVSAHYEQLFCDVTHSRGRDHNDHVKIIILVNDEVWLISKPAELQTSQPESGEQT